MSQGQDELALRRAAGEALWAVINTEQEVGACIWPTHGGIAFCQALYGRVGTCDREDVYWVLSDTSNTIDFTSVGWTVNPLWDQAERREDEPSLLLQPAKPMLEGRQERDSSEALAEMESGVGGPVDTGEEVERSAHTSEAPSVPCVIEPLVSTRLDTHHFVFRSLVLFEACCLYLHVGGGVQVSSHISVVCSSVVSVC